MKYRLFWWGLEYSPSCFCNVHVTILLQACRMNSYNYCFFFSGKMLKCFSRVCCQWTTVFFYFSFFLLRLTCTFYDACFVRLGDSKATGCPGVSTSRLSVGWSVLFPGHFQFQHRAAGSYIQRLMTRCHPAMMCIK